MDWIAVAYLDPELADEMEVSEKRKSRLEKIYNERGNIQFMIEYLTQKFVSKQKYIHCEIVFIKDGILKCVSYAAFADFGIQRLERTYQKDSYKWFFISSTQKQREKLMKWCDEQVGSPFDAAGLRRLLYWPRKNLKRKNKKTHWWCSSFVISALQQIDLFKYINPASIDVEDVIALLHSTKNIEAIGVLPGSHIEKLGFDSSSGIFF